MLFCQRIQTSANESDYEQIWFTLLESVIRYEKKHDTLLGSYKLKPVKKFILECAKYIIENMISYLPLAVITNKIVNDYGDYRFGDYKAIFITMLELSAYDRDILNTATKLFEHDTYKYANSLLKQKRKYISPDRINYNQMKGTKELDLLKRVENCNLKTEYIMVYTC